jgi:ABC-type antimicrobial peptide transport system permease subunit
MLRNYIKIAWRGLLRNRMQTIINLLGLTIGVASCLGIVVYVLAQTGYDTGFTEADSLYRIRTIIKHENNSSPDSDYPTASPPIAFALKEDFPEVREACRIIYINQNDTPMRTAASLESHYAQRGYLADSTFFKLFDYPFLEGSAERSLIAPNSIVLSSALARRLFGEGKALDKIVVLGTGSDTSNKTVTGVFDEGFAKTHLNPNYIISMDTPGLGQFVMGNQNYATQNFVYTYLKLGHGVRPADLEAKFPSFLQNRGAKDLADAGFNKTMLLQPVPDIHLYSKDIGPQLDSVSDIRFLSMLLVLGAIILLVACINYINLRTAFASQRAREIGVRKVIGADRRMLATQFLGESVLLTAISAVISIPLTILVLPYLNNLGQSSLGVADVINFKILTLVTVLAVITGLIAGIYPAMILAGVNPVKALKGGILRIGSGGGSFRKILVVFQFIVSTSLIIAVIVIMQQVRYGRDKDLGYEQENLLAVRLGTSETVNQYQAIRETFESVPFVKQVAGTNNYPSQRIFGDFGGHLPGEDPAGSIPVHYSGITPGYLNTAELKLVAGRDLRDTDSTQTIVNQATLEMLGIPREEAISSKIVNTYEGNSEEYEIVGVVANYHYEPLTEKVAPVALFNENRPGWIVLRTETRDFKELLSQLEAHWKTFSTETPFEYTFVDERVEELFMEEQRLGRISVVFTTLAILISCLGLFGLVSYVAQHKRKEIGIRKVLGASIESVSFLLTANFIKLVLISLLAAFPLAYFLMNRWLENFTYATEIHWWVFAVAGASSLAITVFTVAFQAIKSGLANPVKILRTE